MNVDVYSASKKIEKQFDSPAATYILTNEDIRRSGVTTVMDALRLAPGVSVQKVRGHTWDISIRGFNGGSFANKLLVMIDGRSVYTPLQGGVTWALQDLVLEDIERIEVIRGPGGTLWGANAVNGVINILTKKAKDTQGAMMSGGGGSEESGFGTFRYGGKHKDLFYRSYVKHFHKAEGFRGDDVVNDDWRMTRGGFKAEQGPMTLQGDLYGGRTGALSNRVTPITALNINQTVVSYDAASYGGNILGKYEANNWLFQTYWDRTVAEGLTLRERRDRVDIDLNHHFDLPFRQRIVWGGGYRWDIDQYTNSFEIRFRPGAKTYQTASAFVQDEITLIEKYWKLIAGSKFEYTTYSDFEIQPNIRTVITPFEKHMFWGSVSRPIRTPSRFELDSLQQAVTANIVLVQTSGNPHLVSEEAITWEAGYRTQILPRSFLDLVFYYSEYDHFLGVEYGTRARSNGTNFFLPALLKNSMSADTYGFELAVDTSPKDRWKIRSGYTFTKVNMHLNIGETDLGGVEAFNEGSTPQNIFFVKNSFDLPRGFQFDAVLRYADHLETWKVNPYMELDLRLGYKWKNVLFELVGRDLIEGHHKEHGSSNSTEMERSVFGRTTIQI